VATTTAAEQTADWQRQLIWRCQFSTKPYFRKCFTHKEKSMLKKAATVAAIAAGLAVLGAPAAMAAHHPDEPGQVGVGNVNDVHAANDVHGLENVDVPVCVTHIPVGAGLVGVGVDALNPTFIKDCVDGVAASSSGDHHGG